MRQLDRTSRRLGLILGLMATASLSAADLTESPPCLVETRDARSAPEPLMNSRSNPAALQLLVTEPAQADPTLEPVCAGDRLATLRLKLVPGQTRSMILVSASSLAGRRQAAEMDTGQGSEDNGAWQITLRPVDAEQAPGSARLIELTVTAGAGNRRGQQQSFRLFDEKDAPERSQTPALELVLESLEAERMFRDNFKVEPSLGQFSQQTRQPRPAADRAGRDVENATRLSR
ncbi:MAG: hypothetical protein ACOCVP_03500 [Wenzhouxiangella sp.]